MIRITDLFYSYETNRSPVIKDVKVHINQGEIFGFLGPSGAGKSTLQKIMTGILRDYQGSVQVMGQDMFKVSGGFYHQLGVAFETPDFYRKFTARENLDFFLSFYPDKESNMQELMKSVGLEDALDTRVEAFSKGMKMRLNIVRAFMHEPELVFLDEPTAGLDPVNVRKIKELIQQERLKGRTILINTHNMHVAEALCDRLAFVVDGGIRLIASPEELKAIHSQPVVEVTFEEEGQRIEEHFPLRLIGQNERFQTIIRDFDVRRIRTLEKSLEDIFIDVTGRELDAEESV